MEQQINPVRVWVIDDQASARRLIQEYVTAIDPSYVTQEFVDASDALEAAKTSRPDLVVVDYRMPGEDGISFVRCLHKQLDLPSRVPVIMVSAFHDSSIREFATAAGVTKFISKPLEFDKFSEIVTLLIPVNTPKGG